MCRLCVAYCFAVSGSAIDAYVRCKGMTDPSDSIAAFKFPKLCCMLEITQFDKSSLRPLSYTNVGQITCTRIWVYLTVLFLFVSAMLNEVFVLSVTWDVEWSMVQYSMKLLEIRAMWRMLWYTICFQLFTVFEKMFRNMSL